MLTIGGLFDGVGLLAYGLHLAGLRHTWLCEIDPWRRSILELRFPGIPIYPDVRAVGHGARRPDLIAGGFPCKGVSNAGKREGFGHPETVLWREMARAVRELRPRYVLVENVANILALHDGAVWGEVLGDLAALGYDTVWDCLPAGAVGAPHLRDRVFAVATHTDQCAVEPGRLRWGEREGDQGATTDAAESGWPAGGGSARGGVGRARRRDNTAAGTPAAADTQPVGLAGGTAVRQGRPQAERGGAAAANADASERRTGAERSASRPGRGSREDRPAAAGGSAPAPDPGGGRQPQLQELDSERRGGLDRPPRHDAERRGVRVEWGNYEPAIQRWEAVHGPAPEPLVRRVDARGAARVERSRLSALGDGVQVQIGQLVGAYIIERERMREPAG